MGKDAGDIGNNPKSEKIDGPADVPFWSIVKSLTTGQFYGIILVLVGLFGAGYAIGQWASSAGHERELADKDGTHRIAVAAKDQIITERNNTISDLEDEIEAARRNGEEALQVASAADRLARAFRAKAEFLHRYLSYLEDPDPSGTMRKLLTDHVCVLWRETQRDILTIDSDRITFQQVSRGSNLSPEAIEALASAGIDQRIVQEYLQLNRQRSQIEPRAGTSPGSSFRRLQQLEQRIGKAIQKGVTTKTVTFFDDSRYFIPKPVADDVHRRPDCQT